MRVKFSVSCPWRSENWCMREANTTQHKAHFEHKAEHSNGTEIGLTELLNYDQNLSRRVNVQLYTFGGFFTSPFLYGFDDFHTQLMKRPVASISRKFVLRFLKTLKNR